MVPKDDVPAFYELINPTLRTLHKLGGSASIQELAEEIVDDLKLPTEIAELPHGRGSQTEVEYRAAWARTYMRIAGLVENSDRGVWALTTEGAKTSKVDARKLAREVQRQQREDRRKRPAASPSDAAVGNCDAEPSDWQEEVVETLLGVSPAAFERLCQRLLRESGFIEVEVTGRSGDGGIDGHGIIRVAGLISFTVLFQSKRYRSNIGPETVRDFRGAMIGRADKGLLITTGGFTREARREATRDGAPPIDLIDGELLAEKLKELKLGIETRLVEEVSINSDWFKAI